jgi:hypothetical protein
MDFLRVIKFCMTSFGGGGSKHPVIRFYGMLKNPRAVFLKVWSAAVCQVVCDSFERKIIAKIVSDTERMKNKPIQVCAKLPLLADLQK